MNEASWGMGVRALAGQVLVVGFPGEEAPAELLDACARGELGGIILFKRNLGTMHEVAGLVARFVAASPPDLPLLVAVDQEGGRVARLGAPVLALPAMRDLGSLDDPGLTERVGALLGRQLAALGFTMNFAPVLDVDTNPQNPVIGDRAFGAGPERVVRHGLALARGLLRGGVLPCGKHFPGHGDTEVDSHLGLPRLGHGRARLDQVELVPFAAARGAIAALMTAHVAFDALSGERPATLASEVVTHLLRGELGYDGLVVSDDLEMRAICDQYGIEQAACLAIEAGCDMLLVCSRVDWAERAREALVARALAEPAFKARLADAAQRCVALRRSRPPAPITDPVALDLALARPEAEALAAEIRARIGRRTG